MTKEVDGETGWTAEWYRHENDDSMVPVGDPIRTQFLDETRLYITTPSYPEGLTRRWTMKIHGFLKPKSQDTDFEFGLIVAGRAKVCEADNTGCLRYEISLIPFSLIAILYPPVSS